MVLAIVISSARWFLATIDQVLRPWARFDPSALLLSVIPLIIAVYFVGLWRLSGQTVGKWLLGIRVVSADGGPVSLGRAMLRLVGYLLSALPLYAGFLWVLIDPQRRALHDRLARTFVVYLPK